MGERWYKATMRLRPHCAPAPRGRYALLCLMEILAVLGWCVRPAARIDSTRAIVLQPLLYVTFGSESLSAASLLRLLLCV